MATTTNSESIKPLLKESYSDGKKKQRFAKIKKCCCKGK